MWFWELGGIAVCLGLHPFGGMPQSNYIGDGGLSRFLIYHGSLSLHVWVLLWWGLAWD